MTQKPLYRSLDANLALLEEMFGRSHDFYTKRLMLAGIPCAIVMFTGLSSPEKLCRMALDMLDRDPAMLGGGEGLCDYLLTQSRVPAEPDAVEDAPRWWSCSPTDCPFCLSTACGAASHFRRRRCPSARSRRR